jgi:hypothetical protein
LSYGIYNGVAFTRSSGRIDIAPLASVEVRREDSGALAAIFSDRAGLTPLGNPLTAGSDGMYAFYAAGIEQGYRITATAVGSPTETGILRNQPVGTAREYDVSSFISTLLDDATAAAARTTLGAQQDLSSLATESVVSTADYFVMSDVGSPEELRKVLVSAALALRPLPRSYLAGLGLSIAAGSPTSTFTIDVAAGECRDSTNAVNISLSASIVDGLLQASGAWTAGSGKPKLDTGARANSTWYHVYAIRKDSDGSGEWLFSTNASTPTMPSGYTYFRRIGSVRTDGSGNILGFVQTGDRVIYNAIIVDVNEAAPSTTAASLTLTVPPSTVAIFSASMQFSANEDHMITFYETTQSALTPGFSNASLRGVSNGSTYNNYVAGQFEMKVNSSSQISVDATSNAGTYSVGTRGYTDRRGRDA